ncbi:cytochrome bd-I ubiquinol oxidase subunit 2 apoprotein [Pseudonocardia kunmingensis]|uniref:Cytochrome bd-I ubiquinol oxidase subunit 2 apoprotein n=1 Tax=Pseudonocardia kunmingensis TaxID=630975 RepID=A0A543D1T8_9PSEU|nr:cytochrome bd-I ubiquinol oxidase subunit 2 apoprotein [Pseudonocardia kunmingensis]
MTVDLPTVWFVAIAVLWTGYFVLEGFDFGVGMLLPVLGRGRDADRRVVINAIGPVWDGNEVWLITAVGAMFAAFPAWYAATLSGFYLPVLLIIVALIGRGVAFEYRGKVDDPRWRARWDAAIVFGSAVPAFAWGLVFANIVRGVELGPDGVVRSGLLDLLHPYALVGGLATLALFVLHGAVFLALKTDGPVRRRARTAARATAPVAAAALFAFLMWTQADHGSGTTAVLAAGAVGALLIGTAMVARRREGWAFVATAVAVAATTAVLFVALFPAVLPSLLDPAFDLTVANAASRPYTLTILSWIGVVFLPLVVLYQSWSYWVFRRRVTREHVS